MKPLQFRNKSRKWLILLSTILTILALFHVVRILVGFIEKRGVVGAPSIQYGLVMVLIGSAILLISSLCNFKDNSSFAPVSRPRAGR